MSEIPLPGSRAAFNWSCEAWTNRARGSIEGVLQSLPPLTSLPIWDGVVRRNPITGMDGRCARAPSGQLAAAPPSSVSRGFLALGMLRMPLRSPREAVIGLLATLRALLGDEVFELVHGLGL
jgi:hypothetical protein